MHGWMYMYVYLAKNEELWGFNLSKTLITFIVRVYDWPVMGWRQCPSSNCSVNSLTSYYKRHINNIQNDEA